MEKEENKRNPDLKIVTDHHSSNYHEVWAVLSDVYMQGETDAFKHLSRPAEGEKNLIIFPSEFAKDLWPDDKKEVKRSPGSRAISYFKDNGRLLRSGDDYSLFELDSGLDVAYIKKPGYLQQPNLESRVKKEFGKSPTLMTTNAQKFIDFSAEGLKIEEPKDFILVNSDIVNRGLVIGNDDLCAKIYESNGIVSLEDAQDLMDQELFMNQFIKFIGNQESYARVTADFKKNKHGEIIDKKNPRLELIKIPNGLRYHVGEHCLDSMVGIRPEGIEQYLAVQYGILNPDVELAFICGAQGSGKTIISYSAAVDLILTYPKDIREKRRISRDSGFFDQIVIFRPNDPVGGKKRAEGWLPGDLWKKLKSQFRGFEKAHKKASMLNFPFEQMVLHPEYAGDYGEKRVANRVGGGYLPARNEAIELCSFADIRGVSFERTLMIIDEAQNFKPYEVKTLLSRLGRQSKGLVLGDPEQVDNEEGCTENYNGLTSTIKYYLPFENTFLFSLTENRRTATSRRSIGWHV